MRWAWRRHWKVIGGSSGTVAVTSIGSGPLHAGRSAARAFGSRRHAARRRPARARRRRRRSAPASGRWLSRGSSRTRAPRPAAKANRSASIVPGPARSRGSPDSGSVSCVPVPDFDLGCGQQHQLDAEAGIELAELLLEQLHQRDCRDWAGWCRSRCGRPNRRPGRGRSRACAPRRPPAPAGTRRRAGGWSRQPILGPADRLGEKRGRVRKAGGGQRGSSGSSSVPSA